MEPLSIAFDIVGMSGPGSGVWTRIKSLTRALVDEGHLVHLSGERGVHDEALSLGLTSVVLHKPTGRVNRVLTRKQRIRRFATDYKCDIIHIEAPPFIGVKRIVTLASIHDVRHHLSTRDGRFSFSSFYQKTLLKWFAPNISGWLVLSEFAKGEVSRSLEISPSMIHVIPPILGDELTTRRSRPSGKHINAKFVLVLGHLEKRKNVESIVRATFSASWPDTLELWIAGRDNGSLASLQSISRNSPRRIRFLDPPSEEEKWHLLEQATMVAVPSVVEGFGIVAAESAVAGSAALVGDLTATKELAGSPDAIVSALDPVAWANAISRVFESGSLRSAIVESQRELLGQFSSSAVLPKLLDVYRRATPS